MPTDITIPSSPKNLRAVSVTIKSGASVSETVDTQGHSLIGIIMPAAWTAANLAPKVGYDPAGTLTIPQDSGGLLVQCIAAAGVPIAIPFDPACFFPCLQLASVNTDKSGTAVNQGADRILILLFRTFLS